MVEYNGVEISWLGHDGFTLKKDLTVVIDPFKIGKTPKADILLISHEHFDHCNKEDVMKVISPSTILVTTPACSKELSSMKFKEVRILGPGDTFQTSKVHVRAIAAYNTNKFMSPGKVFHPKEDRKIGFLVTLGDVKLYHTGDSDLIPEMENLQPDVALLPVSGTYVMTVEEAVQAVSKIKPKLAIPMHYGTIVGSERDAERFKELASKLCQVQILKKE